MRGVEKNICIKTYIYHKQTTCSSEIAIENEKKKPVDTESN